jgi:hypothetical protein
VADRLLKKRQPFGVRRLWRRFGFAWQITNSEIQSGVALRLPPHSKSFFSSLLGIVMLATVGVAT